MITTILGIVAALFAGTTIWAFVFWRKEKRRYEANTTKTEEEAKQSASETKLAETNVDNSIFRGLKEQIEFYLLMAKQSNDNYNELLTRYTTIMEENIVQKQTIKEYEYRFKEMERRVTGMEKTITLQSPRIKYAEELICEKTECESREPILGKFEHKKEADEKSM